MQQASYKKLKNQTQGQSFFVQKEKPYIDSLKKEFSFKPQAFAIDTGNGALGPLAKKVFSELGLQTTHLFCKPDGNFPNHHPDPTIEKNIFHLKQSILKNKFPFGFGFDGDGDRLVVVSDSGRLLLGDELAYVFLNCLDPSKRSKPLILADVKCSNWFFDAAKNKGFKILMTKSGHGLMRQVLEKTQAELAIEFSGHIFFNDKKNRSFDDALYASLRFLQLLNSKNCKLTDLLPKISNEKTREIRLNMPPDLLKNKLDRISLYLKKRGESFQSIDGIRLNRKSCWALFRSSQTQSALTMRFEASNKKELKELKKEFSELINLKIP